MDLKSYFRIVPGFPKEGILFVDIMPLVGNYEAFDYALESIVEYLDEGTDFLFDADKVASIEARGYVLGSALADRTGLGQALIRKPGKLPGDVVSKEYALEYGTNKIEMQRDAVKKYENIILVDDLLATGGTIEAAAELIRELEGNVVCSLFLVELGFLKGRDRLETLDIPVHSLTNYAAPEELEEQHKSQQSE